MENKANIKASNVKESIQVKSPVVTQKPMEAKKPTEAIKLVNALAPDVRQQKEEKRTILIEVNPKATKKEDSINVVFTGYWDGRFLQIALREIRRAYFYRRQRMLKQVATQEAK